MEERLERMEWTDDRMEWILEGLHRLERLRCNSLMRLALDRKLELGRLLFGAEITNAAFLRGISTVMTVPLPTPSEEATIFHP